MENVFYKKADGFSSYPVLDRSIKTDVVIIGGGLAGIMCAERLLKQGKRVCILEANEICGGETVNSTAMVSVVHDAVYNRLIKKHGFETAKKYWELAEYGLEEIRRIIDEYKLECDFNVCDMLLYSTTKKGAKEVVKEFNAFDSLGKDVQLTYLTDLPFTVKNALKVEGQGYMNPYLFVSGLCAELAKRGAEVYEHTRVESAPSGKLLAVNGFDVEAEYFVVATHFPYINFPGLYFTKMFQSRSHNVVFDGKFRLKDIYESVEDNGFEFRPLGKYTLCGGANIRTGKYKHKSQYEKVRRYLTADLNVKKENIVGEFAAQDCITFDMLPFVGSYSMLTDNLFVVTGFNKWGFTTSAAAAKIITELILKRQPENIFSPARIYALNSPVKEIQNIGGVLGDYAQLIISTDAKKINRIQPGQGAVIKQNGKRLGVYKNEDGKLDVVSAVCPHLNCSLKWNKDERSWDCPCHGSRFDVKGNILSGPAVKKAYYHGDENDEKNI